MTQIDEGQATIHTAEPDNAADTTTHNVDAHMPPQPKPDENLQADPALVPHWNPDTNEWAPSNEQHETWGVAEPPHYDDPTATPVSESYGQAPSGTVPDARLNLIDSIRPRTVLPAPVVRHEHEVRTTETGSETVRFRQEFVSGLTPTTLLAQNPNRKRALLRVLGSAAQFVVTSQSANNITSTVTVPAGQTWSNISALNFAFTTDANVGLRQLQITVRDPLARVLATYAMTVTQAQSLAQSYQTLAGTSTDTVTGTAHYFPNIFAGLVLTAGSTITVTNIGFSGAGDVFGAPQITMSTGGSISLMPLRDGANAAAANVGWQMSPGDPPIEIKAEAGIEAIASSGFTATVSVYEELLSLGGAPGVST